MSFKLSGAAAALSLFLLAAWAALPWLPGRPPAEGYGPAAWREVLAADGSPLAAPGGRWRAGPWVPADEVPPLVAAAALAAEDRRFLSHPGVDGLAMARAVRQNLAAGRVVSGGSTITMQLARLLEPGPRTWRRKLSEAARALWLEARLDKGRILAQYLNRAPFGGPLVGVGAASRALFDKAPARLSAAEAALLMSLPQDPARLLRTGQAARLRARRDRILRAMAAAGVLDSPALAAALAAPATLAAQPAAPVEAPHFARALSAGLPAGAPSPVPTYLDPALQRTAADLVHELCRARAGEGLRQAAVLVLRNRDRAVLAWVGGPDFAAPDCGQVDGVLARRQPGSALKPFVYALALQRGRHLASLLADEPLGLAVDGGAHRPVDYDQAHRGAVRLRVALASSLNLPAVRLAAELGPQAILERLRALGLALPEPAEHYGLGLALGDGEVSLLELTSAYAALAEDGLWRPARLWRGQPAGTPRRALDPSACRLTTDALADDRARAAGFGRHSLLELPFPAAAKTGTSQQHKDNWCLGFTAEYTVGVWVGNCQSLPMEGVSGLTGAGPLWRALMLALHRHRPGELPAWPPEVTWRRVCPLGGEQAGPACPGALLEAFAPGALPAGPCRLHPASLGGRARPPAPGAAPLTLELVAPLPESIYALDPDLPAGLQVLACRARATGPVSRAIWSLDGRPLATDGDPLAARAPLAPGEHRLVLEAQGPGGRARVEAVFWVRGAPRSGSRTTRLYNFVTYGSG